MGESGRSFGLEVVRKSKLNIYLKKPKKSKLLNMMVSHFCIVIVTIFLTLSSSSLLLSFLFLFLLLLLLLLLL